MRPSRRDSASIVEALRFIQRRLSVAEICSGLNNHSRLPFSLATMGATAVISSEPGVLGDAEKEIIKDTWRLIEPVRDTAADLFYRRLFELKPEYRALFKDDMTAQKRKLIGMLGFIVKALSWPDSMWQEEVDPQSDLFMVVLALGRRHRELYRIPDESYVFVRESLLWSLDYALGEAFTPEARDAWGRVYDLVSVSMKLGRGATDMGKPMLEEGVSQ